MNKLIHSQPGFQLMKDHWRHTEQSRVDGAEPGSRWTAGRPSALEPHLTQLACSTSLASACVILSWHSLPPCELVILYSPIEVS